MLKIRHALNRSLLYRRHIAGSFYFEKSDGNGSANKILLALGDANTAVSRIDV